MRCLITFASLVILGTCADSDDGLFHVYPDWYDPSVVFAVNAINTMMPKSEANTNRIALRIVSATSQVARGIIYRYQIEVTNGANNEICDVTVIHRPWLSSDAAHACKNVQCSPATNAPASNNTTMSTTTSSPLPSTDAPDQENGYMNQTLNVDDDARRALIFFFDKLNSRKSSLPRLIPYDVEVKTQARYGQRTYQFSLRMVNSKCLVTDTNSWGKITFKECPPAVTHLRYTGPKRKITVRWNPYGQDKIYTILT